MTERMFPIMKWSKGTSIPWRIIAPHEPQALRNHDQTLQRLAERGGLDPSEAIAVLRGRKWSEADMVDCDARLERIVEMRLEDQARAALAGRVEEGK